MDDADDTHTEAPALPAGLGENPQNLDIGIGVDAAKARVVVRFNALVQWFDMDAETAGAIGAQLIECAIKAQAADKSIIVPAHVLAAASAKAKA